MKAVVQRRVSRARVLVVNQFTLLGDTLQRQTGPASDRRRNHGLAEKLYEEVAAESQAPTD